MSDTPRTDALISAADKTPECRLTFLIRSLANLAMDLERENERLRLSAKRDDDHPKPSLGYHIP